MHAARDANAQSAPATRATQTTPVAASIVRDIERPRPSQAAQAQSDARMFSASPDSPVANISWRGALRGTVGLRLPIVAPLAATGFLLQLPALIELHNTEVYYPVPWQYWRGRLALEAIYRRDVQLGATPAALSGSLALEHESDHDSADFASSLVGHARMVYVNTVALRGDMTLALGLHSLTVSTLARLHVLSCTIDFNLCGSFGGSRGDFTFESNVDVVFDGTIVPNRPWRLFAALHGAWIVGNRLVSAERRVSLHAGFAARSTDKGLAQVYLQLFAGNDVGLRRATADVLQFGAGFRWGF